MIYETAHTTRSPTKPNSPADLLEETGALPDLAAPAMRSWGRGYMTDEGVRSGTQHPPFASRGGPFTGINRNPINNGVRGPLRTTIGHRVRKDLPP